MTTIIKRPLIVVLISIIILSLVGTSILSSVSAATIKSGKSGSTVVTYLGDGSNGKGWDNPHTSWGKQFKYTVKINGDNVTAYCCEPGKDFTSGKSVTTKTYDKSRAWKKLSAGEKKVVALVMFYGYNEGKDAPYGNKNDYYAATQVMVWEACQGRLYFKDGELKHNKKDDYDLIKNHKSAVKCYNWMYEKIENHSKGASFMSKKSADANPYVMKYDYATGKFSRTVNDTRSGNYYETTDGTSANLSVARSGRSYTFSTKKAGTHAAVFENYLYPNGNKIKDGTKQPLLVAQPSSSKYQSVIFGAEDMTQFYAKFRTEDSGSLVLYKYSNTGVVTGFNFRVVCKENNYDNTITVTKKDGDRGIISLNLYPGTYTVTEVLTQKQKDEGYVQQPTQTVTITERSTKLVTFKNVVPEKDFKIIKKSNNGIVDGFVFNIIDANGNIVLTDTTKNGGIITGKLKPGTYTVKEELTKVQLAEGWKYQEDQTLTITKEQTGVAELTFNNVFDNVAGNVSIMKTTTDGGPIEGFKFKIKGDVYAAEIEAKDVVAGASANAQIEGYTAENWTVDEEDLAKLNKAAKDKKTETVDVKLTTVAHPLDEEAGLSDIDLSVTVKVTLRTVDVKDEDLAEPVSQEVAVEGIDGAKITYNDFEIAASGMTYTGEGTTDKLGSIIKEDLYKGEYTVTEVMTDVQKLRYEQPESQTKVLDPADPASGNFVFENKAIEGDFKLIKTCSDNNVANITFEIKGETVWGDEFPAKEFTTNEEGVIETKLPPGDYTITETGLDSDLYVKQDPKEFTITGEETSENPKVVEFKNIPFKPVEISKVSMTTESELPGASMVLYEKETGDIIETWTSGDVPHIVKGLKEGTSYVLHENLAPIGYRTASSIEFVAGQTEKVTMVDEPTALLITKLDGETEKFLPGAAFEIRDEEGKTICAFDVVKDGDQVKAVLTQGSENGISTEITDVPASSSGDQITEEDPDGFTPDPVDPDEDVTEDSSNPGNVVGEDGTILKAASQTTEEDDELDEPIVLDIKEYGQIRGLIEGNTYYLVETTTPEGYTPEEDIEFVFHDGMALAVENNKPKIETSAKDSETDDRVSYPDNEVTITDTVTYTDLSKGKTYELRAVLMDKSTGEPLLVNGEQVTATKEFVAETRDGTVDVVFTFDASALAGKETVVFETLYYEDVEVCAHADINDPYQTVSYPDLGTKALEEGSSINVIEPKDGVVLTDTVSMKGLTVDRIYTVKGVVMDPETNEPLLINGVEVRGETTFTAESTECEVVVTFPAFDATEYAGKDFVMFEQLYLVGEVESEDNIVEQPDEPKDPVIVGSHEDIDDELQTIHVSELQTTAEEESTGKNEVTEKKDIVIKDTIEYKNLVPGKEYTITSVLMDKETEESLKIMGKEITAEMKFVPEEPNGTVVITFPAFNGNRLGGHELVVFENIYHKDVLVASHADIDDEAQTVTVHDNPNAPQTGDGSGMMDMLLSLMAGLACLVMAGALYVRKRNA